jgi:hypothetical protein
VGLRDGLDTEARGKLLFSAGDRTRVVQPVLKTILTKVLQLLAVKRCGKCDFLEEYTVSIFRVGRMRRREKR